MKRPALALAVLLPCLVAAGCGGVAPLPDDHYYRLVPGAPPPALSAPALPGVLAVELPSASGVRDGREMLYSAAPYVRFQQYHYHHWEAAPPRLLQHRLVDGLRAAGVATAVLAGSAGRQAFRLDSHLARFERLIDGDRYRAGVELHVRLFDERAPGLPLLVADYAVDEPAADATMEATARAFSAAVDTVLRQLVADLAALGGGGS